MGKLVPLELYSVEVIQDMKTEWVTVGRILGSVLSTQLKTAEFSRMHYQVRRSGCQTKKKPESPRS